MGPDVGVEDGEGGVEGAVGRRGGRRGTEEGEGVGWEGRGWGEDI